ncbi:uncharacterized protein LOC128232229 [Mya arenaria]|uniref:uncharacterized protein LOC128232229 n=1 Tax=Mya arenaria TaxID=6604 RepID=UPI0022E17E7E|nr:uncharacterized protein LOC128232229 [Mya arenaria]
MRSAQKQHVNDVGNGVRSALSLFLTVLAVILLCGGFVSPGWIYLDSSDESQHVGLWYTVSCDRNTPTGQRECETFSLLHWSTETRDAWLTSQVETSVAVGLSVFALILLLSQRGSGDRKSRKVIGFFAIFVCFAAGILALIPVGQKGNHVRKLSKDSSNVSFPYSLFLFGVGGVLLFVVSLILFFDIMFSYQKRKSYGKLVSLKNGSGNHLNHSKEPAKKTHFVYEQSYVSGQDQADGKVVHKKYEVPVVVTNTTTRNSYQKPASVNASSQQNTSVKQQEIILSPTAYTAQQIAKTPSPTIQVAPNYTASSIKAATYTPTKSREVIRTTSSSPTREKTRTLSTSPTWKRQQAEALAGNTLVITSKRPSSKLKLHTSGKKSSTNFTSKHYLSVGGL